MNKLTNLASYIIINALAILVIGCGDTHYHPPAGTGRTNDKAGRVKPLMVVPRNTPVLDVPRYRTSGVYPYIFSRHIDMSAINKTIRGIILDDQRDIAPEARNGAIGTAKRYHGTYETSIDRRYMSASTGVVSVLIPVTRLYPGGDLGRDWLSATVQVPSGRVVSITDLLSKTTDGLAYLDREARRYQVRHGRKICVQNYSYQYAPKAENYEKYALTIRGLVIGLSEVPVCGRQAITIPYGVLRPYLSPLGKELVAAVRSATVKRAERSP